MQKCINKLKYRVLDKRNYIHYNYIGRYIKENSIPKLIKKRNFALQISNIVLKNFYLQDLQYSVPKIFAHSSYMNQNIKITIRIRDTKTFRDNYEYAILRLCEIITPRVCIDYTIDPKIKTVESSVYIEDGSNNTVKQEGITDICLYILEKFSSLCINKEIDKEYINKAQSFADKASLVEKLTLCENDIQFHTIVDDNLIGKYVLYCTLMTNTRIQALQSQSPNLYTKVKEFMSSLENIDENIKILHEIYLESNKKRMKERKEASKGGSFDIDLPNASKNNVVTRFPPEPSGYLHIGHVKAQILNHYFAEKYNGTMLLRFDDTNAKKEKDEFVEAIMKDCKTLGVKYKGPTYTSDYMDIQLEYGEKMIRINKAYVDDTPVDEMRKMRQDMIESKNRNISIEKNLELWNEMLKGSTDGLKCCLRAKIDINHPVGCMRDPTIFRCSTIYHHRQGTKYKCYPTYDFACPIIDSIEGVTHALRTIEFHDRNEQYYWICDTQGIRRPYIWDFSRLNFTYTVLSKRKLQWFVDNKYVEGWFDPRFPTLQGMIRHGLLVEALRNFMILQGPSRNITLMEWDKLWSLNHSIIELNAPRYNAIDKDNMVPITLQDIDDNSIVQVPLHPKDKASGTKQVVRSKVIYIDQKDACLMSENEEVTLITWGNIYINTIKRSDDNKKILSIIGTTNIDGDFKSTKLKIQWLGCNSLNELCNGILIEYGPIITIKQPTGKESMEDIVNRKSIEKTDVQIENSFKDCVEGDIIQFQRKGFYRIDKIENDTTTNVNIFNLIYIPDGKTKRPLPGIS